MSYVTLGTTSQSTIDPCRIITSLSFHYGAFMNLITTFNIFNIPKDKKREALQKAYDFNFKKILAG